MNAREGIVPILNVYVRMRFWISVRWRLTTLPHGVTEDEPLLIIARCYAVTATVGKAQDKHFAISRCSDDTFDAPCKVLSISNIAIFRVAKIPTLKMVKCLLLSCLQGALYVSFSGLDTRTRPVVV